MFSNKVKKIVNYYKNKNKAGLRQHLFYQQIINETNFLPKECVISQRFWHILNNTKTVIKCYCNNNVNWCKQKKVYNKYCSCKCSSKYSANSKHTRNKYKLTCLDRYRVENPFQSKKIKEKIKKTNLKKYGAENVNQSQIIKNKAKQTCLKLYGKENPFEIEEFKNKSKQTCLTKYNVENYTQIHLSKETLNKLKDKEWLKNEHHNKKKTIDIIAKELGLYGNASLNRYFKKYNIEVLYFASSEAEKKLIYYIKSIYSNKILTNTYKIINPLELDIYLPKEKLAFEFNGLYWHSVIKKDKIYHFNKSKLCADKNIKLIHIFENEWEENKEEIKYWISKYINQDEDFITKDLLIKDLKNDLDLSLNWPINYNKLEELGYILINRSAPEEQTLGLDNKNNHKIYDCGKIRYSIYKSFIKTK